MDKIKPSYYSDLPKYTFTCTVCKKEFRAVALGHERKYCSMKCSLESQAARSKAKILAARSAASKKKPAKHK